MKWAEVIWDDLQVAMKLAFPAMTAAFRVTQLQRSHWLNRITDGSLQAPWGIVQIPAGARQADGYGAGKIVWKVPVTVYYIDHQEGQNKASDIENILGNFETIIATYGWRFTVPDDCFAMDVSDTCPVNQIFFEGRLPYFGGSFSFDAIIGYIT